MILLTILNYIYNVTRLRMSLDLLEIPLISKERLKMTYILDFCIYCSVFTGSYFNTVGVNINFVPFYLGNNMLFVRDMNSEKINCHSANISFVN